VATRRRRDNHYDLDMNDIHQTIKWVSKKSRPTSNPDFENSASDQHQAFNLFLIRTTL
jgi:hypothetical protein